MYQVLFDMTVNLCENFTALTPFEIRREKFHEVIKLFIRLIDKRQRSDKNGDTGTDNDSYNKNKTTHKYSGGYLHGNSVTRDANGVIRRPAKDDSWY